MSATMCTTASFAPSSLLSSRFSNGTVSFACLLSARAFFFTSRDARFRVVFRVICTPLVVVKHDVFFLSIEKRAMLVKRRKRARERKKKEATK